MWCLVSLIACLVSLITCLGEYRCLVSLITSGEFNHGL
jgi:hypothetical protein